MASVYLARVRNANEDRFDDLLVDFSKLQVG